MVLNAGLLLVYMLYKYFYITKVSEHLIKNNVHKFLNMTNITDNQ